MSEPAALGGPSTFAFSRTVSVTWRHVFTVTVIAIMASAYVVLRGTSDPEVSDFDQLWHGARALIQGENPYQYVGPTGVFGWAPLYYPLPAMLLVSPLALLPLLAARAVFAAISAGVLAAALLRDSPVRLLVFLSAPMVIAIGRGQWSPLLVAAAYFPSMAWVGLAKPNIALAVLFGSRKPWSAVTSAVIGGAILIAVSFIIEPGWLASWLEALGRKRDGVSVLIHGGGLFIPLVLLRWRRPESRMLAALGSVPQTPSFYDTVPLIMVPRGFRETSFLVIAGNLALLLLVSGVGLRTEQIGPLYAERVLLWSSFLLYLPCVFMILRRPNDAHVLPDAPFQKGLVDAAMVIALVASAFFAIWATLARYI